MSGVFVFMAYFLYHSIEKKFTMKLYRTKSNNVINLDEITLIYKDKDTGIYSVVFKNKQDYSVPELTEEDIENILDYNNYLIFGTTK